MNTFKEIGNACGGLLEVSKETWEKFEITKGKIKIRNKYTRFIPATISISDKKGNRFLVQIVIVSEMRWLIERNPKIHGMFSREAAMEYDEFNSEKESYCFIGNI